MQTEKTKMAKKPYAIKKDSIKRVCNSLVEISYYNQQETVESKYIRAICIENKTPMLFNAMLTLGYLKKIKHSVYSVMFSREVVNEKLAVRMWKQYNKIKKNANQISETKKAVEQGTFPPIPAPSLATIFDFYKAQPKETELQNSHFALIREEDVISAITYSSLDELMKNPPKEYGRYVIVSVGRKLEIKPQIILD